MLSVREIKELAKKEPYEVYLTVRSLDLKEAVKWIRQFQEAQSTYSKAVGQLDGTAIRLQEIYLMIYRKVMRAYIIYMTKKGMAANPKTPKEKIKMAAKVSFGEFMRSVNY
jgi:hypothetical protein